MANFAESLPPGATREELIHTIRGRGAFRRLKNGICYYQASSGMIIKIRHTVKLLSVGMEMREANTQSKPKKTGI